MNAWNVVPTMNRRDIARRAAVIAFALAAASGLSAHNAREEDNAGGGASPAKIAEAEPRMTRSVAEYLVPSVELVREDGRVVRLADELADPRPVVLNFIYTTCTGICPMLSQTLAELQGKLGAQRDRVHLVSVSIDPEEDTPARLTQYARRFDAGPQWHHYTGTVAASLQVQRAFGAYRGDKMSHTPVTLLRPAPGRPWVRFDGYATADELLWEFRDQIGAR